MCYDYVYSIRFNEGKYLIFLCIFRNFRYTCNINAHSIYILRTLTCCYFVKNVVYYRLIWMNIFFRSFWNDLSRF